MTEVIAPAAAATDQEVLDQRAPKPRDAVRRRTRRETLTGYTLIAPALFGVFAFLLLPILVLIPLTFTHWDLLHPLEWVGAANWEDTLAKPEVWRSFGVTTLFVLMVMPLQVGLGLWLATLLVKGLPGSPIFRTLMVLPWVSAPVVLGVVWRWILDYDGVVNNLLDTRIGWLTDASLALPMVAFVQAWTQIGYVSLFFMSGLSNIPDSLVEAARMDGATERQIFWRIKLPLLRPTMFFVTVTGMIATFQAFDLVYTLSPSGGPQGTTDLIAARIYAQAIPFANMGEAAVLAIMLFVVLVGASIAQNAYFSRKMTYER